MQVKLSFILITNNKQRMVGMNKILKNYYDEIESTNHLQYQGLAYIINEVQLEINRISYPKDITYNADAINHANDDLTWYLEVGDGLKNAIFKGMKPYHPIAKLNHDEIENICFISQRKYLFPHDVKRLLELFKRILEVNNNRLIEDPEHLLYIKRIAKLLCAVGFNRESHDVDLNDFK